MRRIGSIVTAALLGFSSPALAAPLIAFTDTDPFSATDARLNDVNNAAVGWTQTVATSNVTLQAFLVLYPFPNKAPASWYVTDRIGAGTTTGNVIASGSYTASAANPTNYNLLTPVTLATGLNFAAGSYYLVLDGPVSTFPNVTDVDWVGGPGSVALAPGFSLDGYFRTGAGAPFAPASDFTGDPGGNYAFGIFTAPTAAVPEPGTWAMLLLGFAATGAALRRRRQPAGAMSVRR